MTIIEDVNSDNRSLMNRATCVCDGEKNGIPCKYFWSVTQKFRAANADGLRLGEKNRSCTLTPSFLLEFTSEELPTYCNMYEPRKTQGLVQIARRTARAAIGLKPKAGSGYESYDTVFTKFNPVTPEEQRALREEFPDVPGFGGMRPDMMNLHDIINGPQIGIVKPGEEPPTLGLSEETERGIFGNDGGGGIFRK